MSRPPPNNAVSVVPTTDPSAATPLHTVSAFLYSQKCFEVLPLSAKVVVLDTNLTVADAFHAVSEHRLTSAPLWDSEKADYAGMLTVTDFIRTMLQIQEQREQLSASFIQSHLQELEVMTVKEWKKSVRTRTNRGRKLISLDPEHSLLDACKVIKQYRIHRVPLIANHTLGRDRNVLYILTHARILRYLWHHCDRSLQAHMWKKTIGELGMGKQGSVVTISLKDSVSAALRTLYDSSLSAVPVLDEGGRVVDVYSRTDVMYMAAERSYQLDISIEDALQRYSQLSEKPTGQVHTCIPGDTLEYVVQQLVENQVHRLIVVDEQRRPTGIVSMSDIFDLFMGEESDPEDAEYVSQSKAINSDVIEDMESDNPAGEEAAEESAQKETQNEEDMFEMEMD